MRLIPKLFLCVTLICTSAFAIFQPPVKPVSAIAALMPLAPLEKNNPEPVYIILFVGDGMGAEHRKAAQWVAYGFDGQLIMDQLPVQGWSQTASASSSITDSAAGATAIATGTRANNGVISLSPDGENLTSILEYAQAHGLSTGLVTTVQITHATPAAFAAHVPSRTMMTEIALQMLNHSPNVLLGGGEDEFLPTGTSGCYPQDGEREDGRNLIQEAVNAGYTYVCNESEFTNLDTENTDYLLGLFADEGMLRPFTPTLTEMTETAINVLNNDPDGFFLMVEGGQIDWASHSNDAANAIQDTIDFDEAVEVGVNFIHSVENGLLVVTADHETGGKNLNLPPTGDSEEDGPFYALDGTAFYVNWADTYHTAADVPITAMGIGAQRLNSTVPNTDIFWALSWGIFSHSYLPVIVVD